MRLVSSDQPLFLLIAGPNGSGKSSFYSETIIQQSNRSFWIINPDKLAARIAAEENEAGANLEAVKRIETWLEASIRSYQTIGVETVLSTDKYRRLVRLAKDFHFQILLVYVLLKSPELSVERVRIRVQTGGHAVPEQKIIERYSRSLEQLPWFLEAADYATVFDNSEKVPRKIAEKAEGVLTVDEDALEPIKQIARQLAQH